MRKKLLIGLVLFGALVIGGFATLQLWLPRVILWRTLNSFPDKPWLVESLKNEIVMVVFDERTKEAFGGHTKEIFRKNFAKLLPILRVSNPKVIVVDVGFEGETPVDAKLQETLNSYAMWQVVWSRSKEQDSRFIRRAEQIKEPLTLGHIEIIYSTLFGKQFMLISPCIITDDGKAIPPLALVAYQTMLGRLSTYADENCTFWENGKDLQINTKLGSNDVLASMHYKSIPMLTAKNGNRWVPIRYLGKEGLFKRISFTDVINRPFLEARNELWNKIILVGVTLPEVKDRHPTEVGDMDGLEIHAHILATIMRVLVDKK